MAKEERVGRWRGQKHQGIPLKNQVLFEKETLGSPSEGVRSHVIVIAKSHDLPYKEMMLAPGQRWKDLKVKLLWCAN